MIEGELDMSLSRPRYTRGAKPSTRHGEGAIGAIGHRHGHRSRSLLGSFGRVEIEVPRAGLNTADGKTTEWKSKALRAYQRRTLVADALIAGSYLAGTNTRRVRRALAALFGGAVGKDTVSRVWRKVKTDWEAWNARPLVEEPMVRLILDGTVVRVRLDRKATSISLLVVIGVREDGQKVLLAIKSMGGESTEAWRSVLDDLIKRGLRRPGPRCRRRAGAGEGDRRRVGLGEKVNCTDSADTVSTFANLIGCDLWQSRMESSFDLNEIIAVATTRGRGRSKGPSATTKLPGKVLVVKATASSMVASKWMGILIQRLPHTRRCCPPTCYLAIVRPRITACACAHRVRTDAPRVSRSLAPLDSEGLLASAWSTQHRHREKHHGNVIRC